MFYFSKKNIRITNGYNLPSGVSPRGMRHSKQFYTGCSFPRSNHLTFNSMILLYTRESTIFEYVLLTNGTLLLYIILRHIPRQVISYIILTFGDGLTLWYVRQRVKAFHAGKPTHDIIQNLYIIIICQNSLILSLLGVKLLLRVGHSVLSQAFRSQSH